MDSIDEAKVTRRELLRILEELKEQAELQRERGLEDISEELQFWHQRIRGVLE